MTQCDLPPKGWICYLEDGHEGPCPTWPVYTFRERLRIAFALFREAFKPSVFRYCSEGHRDCWGPNVPFHCGGCGSEFNR